jgi:hypothetical protein
MIKVLADGRFEKGQYEFKCNTAETSEGITFFAFMQALIQT